MKIGIIGYGLEGQAAYRYWKNQGEVTICDQDPNINLPEGTSSQLGDNYLANLDQFDVIVRSPGIKPDVIKNSSPTDISSRITTNTNEFLRTCPTSNIIGVTGTKGKGTTATLIARLLEADGKTVHIGGNIGVPALELLEQSIQKDDWVILELSSFQLVDCHYSPHIAVCLMVAPEHIDWHQSPENYFNAKSNLFRYQTTQDIAVYLGTNTTSTTITEVSKGTRIPFFVQPGAIVKENFISIDNINICPTNQLGLIGKHNWQNICAALTVVWQINRNKESISKVLHSFKGLEHRLELVGEVNRIKYYDDSFATTPEAAIVAIEAFSEPKILILGGSNKGASYDNLAQAVKSNNVKQVLLIGEQAERIRQALELHHFNNYQQGGQDMNSIVGTAANLATSGDVVILSPACASFDMFKNYKDRGEKFKQAVQSLTATFRQ